MAALVLYTVFTFALGACIGSFLNVVVWRLPRVELPADCGVGREFLLSFRALSSPPSHCPTCGNRLKWYDNLPIVGWVKLGGRCRFCRKPISPRYPIVEAATALLFAGYFLAYFGGQVRSCCPVPTYNAVGGLNFPDYHGLWTADGWPIYGLYMATLSALLAASLIDAELYIIPLGIPWLLAAVALVVHPLADGRRTPGSVNLVGPFAPLATAVAAGGTLGLLVSVGLWAANRIPTSFPAGEPMLDVDRRRYADDLAAARAAGEPFDDEPLPPPYTFAAIRREIAKEMLFLLPPLAGAGAAVAAVHYLPAVAVAWERAWRVTWFNALLGSLLGGLVGAAVPWLFRILGTLAFRRVAMGLGDVHLMFAIGTVVGGLGAAAVFFLAPFFSLAVAAYLLLTRRGREIPLGPFLSLAAAFVLLFYCPIADYLTAGVGGLLYAVTGDGG